MFVSCNSPFYLDYTVPMYFSFSIELRDAQQVWHFS